MAKLVDERRRFALVVRRSKAAHELGSDDDVWLMETTEALKHRPSRAISIATRPFAVRAVETGELRWGPDRIPRPMSCRGAGCRAGPTTQTEWFSP